MKKNLVVKIIILSIFILLSRSAFAAIVEVTTDKSPVKVGELLSATLMIDTEGESINTIEGDLKYDENILKAEVVNIGGSFISFWVEKPDTKTLGTIHFSGITPGGITTTNGEVFKVIFRAKNTGEAKLLLNNVSLFLNDGEGSMVPAKIKNTSIKINQGDGEEAVDIISNDETSPEKFSIMRARDPAIFDNKWFVVFSTIDKGSGIDNYQVCELFECVSSESPFLLKNQTPFYRVVVHAYDTNGNFVSATLTSVWLSLLSTLFIILVCILVFVFYRRYLHSYKV